MCINCVRAELQSLYATAGFVDDEDSFICVLDHGLHVHIRFNHGGTTGDWHLVGCTLALLQRAVPSQTRLHIHKNKRKASPDLLTALDHHSGSFQHRRKGSGSTCAVCFEAMTGKDEPELTLPCGHTYHKTCLRHWLANYHATCPTCRMVITEENLAKTVSLVAAENANMATSATSENVTPEEEQASQPNVRLAVHETISRNSADNADNTSRTVSSREDLDERTERHDHVRESSNDSLNHSLHSPNQTQHPTQPQNQENRDRHCPIQPNPEMREGDGNETQQQVGHCPIQPNQEMRERDGNETEQQLHCPIQPNPEVREGDGHETQQQVNGRRRQPATSASPSSTHPHNRTPHNTASEKHAAPKRAKTTAPRPHTRRSLTSILKLPLRLMKRRTTS